MASTKEETERIGDSEQDPEKPQSGDEKAAATEDSMNSLEMAAIVVKIKDLEDNLDTLSQNHRGSDWDSLGKGPL